MIAFLNQNEEDYETNKASITTNYTEIDPAHAPMAKSIWSIVPQGGIPSIKEAQSALLIAQNRSWLFAQDERGRRHVLGKNGMGRIVAICRDDPVERENQEHYILINYTQIFVTR